MISKILLTLAVIAALALYLRYTASRSRGGADGGATPLGEQDRQPPVSPVPRIAAIVLVAFMLLISGAILFLEWRDRNTVVRVHVINATSGERLTYSARRGDIEPNTFVTVEGQRITPARVERVEIESIR